jgi:hypothetical protein
LTGHDSVSVQKMGWGGIKNGKLLALAQAEFDVFLTADRNLSFQPELRSSLARCVRSAAFMPLQCSSGEGLAHAQNRASVEAA